MTNALRMLTLGLVLVTGVAQAGLFSRKPKQEPPPPPAPILLGMGRGDVMLVPNDAPMSAIPPAKRITPAGRYRSWLLNDSHGKQVLSIDYDAAISMHRPRQSPFSA